MPTIKPFRDHSPHEVINLFGVNSTDANKGTLVKIATGWLTTDEFITDTIGLAYANTVSSRYGVTARVTATSATGDTAIGILLHDVKESDENGELLKYNPRKQAEMGCVLSGQACPILTRGVVAYSGAHGAVTAGTKAYVSGNGTITTVNNGQQAVGRFLGANDAKGFALLKIEL
jgi:hypothetical protein